MRMLCLPLVAELGNGSRLAVVNEDWVVAEALASARLVDDSARKRAGASQLQTVRREGDEFGDVPCTPAVAFDAAQPLEEPADGVVSAGVGRLDSRPAVEPLDLDPGILTEHPGVGLRVRAAERGLQPCVVVVRLARLRGIVARLERRDRPAGQQPLELACLVRISR